MLRVTEPAGQQVVGQVRHVGRAGLLLDHFQHVGGEDLGPEERGHRSGAHLVDRLAQFACGRFGEVRRLDRADHRQPIAAPEVRPRVVIHDHLAVGLGNRCDGDCECGVQRLQFRHQRRRSLPVASCALRIDRGHDLRDAVHIGYCVNGIRPEVCVKVVGVAMRSDLLGRIGCEHLGRWDRIGQREVSCTAGVVRDRKRRHDIIQAHAVFDVDIGVRERARVLGARLVSVAVRSHRDDAGHRHLWPRHPGDQGGQRGI